MILTETIPVADSALPLDAFRAHLRLGTGFGTESLQDEVLIAFLRASLAAVETRIGKRLIAREFLWQLEDWGAARGETRLPVAPVTAVNRVEILPLTGAAEVVGAARYHLVADAHVPKLVATANALPQIPTGGAARVTLVAGMAEGWGGLPADLAQAVLMLASHYYEYRHDTGLDARCMPFGVTSLLQRYRMPRLAIGGHS